MSLRFICLLLSLSIFVSCQNGSGSSAEKNITAISSADYDYLTNDYKGENLKEGFKLEKIKEQSFKETYNNAPANYKALAYKVILGSGDASAILIELQIDRQQSSLLGKAQRKSDTKYICLPSAKASESLHSKYVKDIQSLGYKDFEVYTSFLSRVFADLYL